MDGKMKPLNDQLLAHHTNTLKLGVGFGNSVNPYLDEMRAIIRKRVAGFDSEKRTKARLQKLIETLANQLDKPAGKWLEQLKSELKSFAKYEADYQAETIGGFVKVELTAPTVNQVWAAAQFQPLALGTKPVDFEKLIDDWGAEEVSRLVMGVKTGFIQGQTAKQIIKDVVGAGGLSDISKRNAMSLAQTAVAHVASEARFETYKENGDVLIGYEWVSTLDSRTSPICRERDGTVYKFDDRSAPKPPAHYNCLSGDTLVTTCSPVSNMYKRSYKGAIVNIRTKSGRTMTITPNHPVLTCAGWVAAGNLNLGSKLVCCNDISLVVKHQKDCVISKFSELFSSAYVFGDSDLVSDTPSSAKNFHGDISNGEINIVSVDSESWIKIKSSIGNDASNNSFPLRHAADLALLADSRLVNPLIGKLDASSGGMGIGGKGCDLIGSASCHPSKLLLTSVPSLPVDLLDKTNYWASATGQSEVGSYPISTDSAFVCGNNDGDFGISEFDGLNKGDLNSSADKDSFNWLFSTAEKLPNLISSNLVDGVELDDVIDLFFSEFDGHVYNLENKNNWYLSNGIVTHNCRSTTSPVLSPEFDFLDEGATRAAKGAGGGTTVDADTTYYGFLKNQPAAYQDEVLGKTKGLIFRNAGLSPEEFRKLSVDNLGRPLTIDQLISADKRIAEYMQNKV